MTKKVFVTRLLPDKVMQELAKICDYDANTEPRFSTREELFNAVKNYEAIICMLDDKFDEELINSAGDNLKVISNFAVGFNNIDVKAAKAKNIFVTNTPNTVTTATADLGLALMLAAARRIPEGDKCVRNNQFEWGHQELWSYEITDKTLGIIGAGRIGSDFGRKAALGFNMKVLYSGHHNSPELDKIGGKLVSLDELLRNSDFISLHVPLTPETKHLIGENEFAKMKPSAILINTARGPVVDENALINALKNKIITAAGLDVYDNEPNINPEFKKLDNVVLMPHVGTLTLETRIKMGLMLVKNVEAVLKGETPPNAVN